jgi:hypothetical protein
MEFDNYFYKPWNIFISLFVCILISYTCLFYISDRTFIEPPELYFFPYLPVLILMFFFYSYFRKNQSPPFYILIISSGLVFLNFFGPMIIFYRELTEYAYLKDKLDIIMPSLGYLVVNMGLLSHLIFLAFHAEEIKDFQDVPGYLNFNKSTTSAEKMMSFYMKINAALVLLSIFASLVSNISFMSGYNIYIGIFPAILSAGVLASMFFLLRDTSWARILLVLLAVIQLIGPFERILSYNLDWGSLFDDSPHMFRLLILSEQMMLASGILTLFTLFHPRVVSEYERKHGKNIF